MGILLFHILVWVTGVHLVGTVFRRWASRVNVASRALILWGGALGVAAMVAPLLGAFLSQRDPLFRINRGLEFWLIWSAVALLLGFLGWRVNRVLADGQRVVQLRSESWGSWDSSLAGHAESLRQRLEARLKEQSGNPKTVLRWSEKIQLPFTVGALTPEVFAPTWAAYEADGIHLWPLLAHEREHIRLGHATWSTVIRSISGLMPHFKALGGAMRLGLEVEADRNVVSEMKSSEDSANQYVETLQAVVGPAIGSGPEAGLGHDRSNVRHRVSQLLQPASMEWKYPVLAAAIVLSMIGCHRVLGRVDVRELVELAMLRVHPSYNLQSPIQGVSLHSLPGRGGALLDGLEVDARRVQAGKAVELMLLKPTPVVGTEAPGFRGRFKVTVVKRGADPSLVPVVLGEVVQRVGGSLNLPQPSKVGSATLMEMDTLKDLDLKALNESGVVEVAVGVGANSGLPEDELKKFWFVYVPSGWVLRIEEVQIEDFWAPSRTVAEVGETRRAFFRSIPAGALSFRSGANWGAERIHSLLP